MLQVDENHVLKSGTSVHIYSSAEKGKYFFDFSKDGKQFYSFLVTITEHGGTFGNVDLTQISGKDIHEAIGFLVARKESGQIKPFKEER
ncbi:MAG TPA: hypothetical protein VK483_06280 [Chitinophagaceae bacterium]|nr:hypothetical protein [Chitinophagaceae bacterium]